MENRHSQKRTTTRTPRRPPLWLSLCRWLYALVNGGVSAVGVLALGAGVALLVYFSTQQRRGPHTAVFSAAGALALLYGVLVDAAAAICALTLAPRRAAQKTLWTRRNLLLLAQALLLSLCAAECVLLAYAALLREEFRAFSAGDALSPNVHAFTRTFDELFFAAQRECGGAQAVWFWAIVHDHCEAALARTHCAQCRGALAFCPADRELCLSLDHEHAACPFAFCSDALLDFTADRIILSFLYAVLTLLFLHVVAFFANLVLLVRELFFVQSARVLPLSAVKVRVVPVVKRVQLAVVEDEIFNVAPASRDQSPRDNELFS